MNWIDANGVGLRYDLHGETGPVLVLIHEMGGTIESWARVAPKLSKYRRVLCFDMPGAGQSEKIIEDIKINDLSANVASLLDALEIFEPVAVAGCAVGGAVALSFAIDYPERTSAVVVLNPAIDAKPDTQKGLVERAELIRSKGMRSIEASSLDTGYPQRFRDREPDHYSQFRARWLANDPVSLGFQFRMLAKTNLFPDLGKIKAPVLALAGVYDPLRPPSYVRSVAERIAQHVVIEIDAAHHVPDQAPAAVSEHIGAFLDRVQPVSRGAP
jgi:3-oxoadipate enol-lactonase